MYPLTAAIIIADSYMDDIASGAISVAEGHKLIKQILTVMDAGGFRGHKISTNDPGMVEGHLERVAIFGDASQTGIGVVAYLIKNDNGVRRLSLIHI